MRYSSESTRLDAFLPEEVLLELEDLLEVGILSAAARNMARARRKAYFPSMIPVPDEADVIAESTFYE